VLDEGGHLSAIGLPGELYIGGSGLARGYVGHAGWTAERFGPDRLSGQAGARLYRTGDRVRWNRTGELEFLGRADHQVKIRGFRIELGEIEAVLRACPEVEQAVLIAGEDDSGEKRLVGYVVLKVESEYERQMKQIGDQLRARLPEYMTPATLVRVSILPLTPNGKVDRKALPSPVWESAGRSYVAPRNRIEDVLCRLWAEVLGLRQVGVADNFFALGGHSLLATRVISRVRSAFNIELPLQAIFTAPVIAGLAKRIEECQAENGNGNRPVDIHSENGQEQMLAALESLSESEVQALLKTINQTI